MKRNFILFAISLVSSSAAFAANTVFDSMDNAKEVKLQPAMKTTTTSSSSSQTTVQNASSYKSPTIKEQKYNSMLVNLDDAQVELRQELATRTSQYTTALNEKQNAIANCKALKKQVNAIKKEMKNVDKSKKMINKNLQQNSAV